MSRGTIKDVIESASILLADCSDSAKLDAQVLLAHVLDKDLTYLITWSDKSVSSQVLQHFDVLLERRQQGEPVAYIVGHKEFWSLPLAVAPSTLIPRPDTETLVELVLEHVEGDNIKLLDLGTGTGAIALALASENPSWHVSAVDFNQEAVKLAQTNVQQLGFTNVSVLASNWFSNIAPLQCFDVIVSNPPYIDAQDIHLSEGDVRFEPHTALVAGNKGLADIEHIIEQSRYFLCDDGRLYIEHGFEQGAAVRQFFTVLGYENATTVKDLGGNDRITWALFSSQSDK
ncbi:peptide chain release factor N(5)-glutamine methyltransferase [Thalassotalea atypica]|uniref:peptide chain release factor N(5)-glutamine methyltransferase n=1 Tax=Thalassotalea atypica TaxID=2054316 RepID=UPI002573D8B0|nr:peptide chain release factor N(5)-glutamine methyltransferase [Thalassotalea atypica]